MAKLSNEETRKLLDVFININVPPADHILDVSSKTKRCRRKRTGGVTCSTERQSPKWNEFEGGSFLPQPLPLASRKMLHYDSPAPVYSLNAASDMERIEAIPYDQRSEDEKELILEEVATRLACIAIQQPDDDAEGDIPSAQSYFQSESEGYQIDSYKSLGLTLRSMGDNLNKLNPELLANLQYMNFEAMLEKPMAVTMPEQNKIAGLFSIASSVASFFGKTSQQALHVKELVLQYFEDKLASYVINHGGWDFVLDNRINPSFV